MFGGDVVLEISGYGLERREHHTDQSAFATAYALGQADTATATTATLTVFTHGPRDEHFAQHIRGLHAEVFGDAIMQAVNKLQLMRDGGQRILAAELRMDNPGPTQGKVFQPHEWEAS